MSNKEETFPRRRTEQERIAYVQGYCAAARGFFAALKRVIAEQEGLMNFALGEIERGEDVE